MSLSLKILIDDDGDSSFSIQDHVSKRAVVE